MAETLDILTALDLAKRVRQLGVSEHTIGSLLGFSQSAISEIMNGRVDPREGLRFDWSELLSVIDRFSEPEKDLMGIIRSGQYPSLWLLDILPKRGFITSIDQRVPLRTFYAPEGSLMVNGRVVHPLYLSFRSRPHQLKAPITVIELPTAENFHVSYSDENFADLTGHFSTNGLPLDYGSRRILKALHL